MSRTYLRYGLVKNKSKKTKAKQMRTEVIIGNTLCVIRLGVTSNDKIAPKGRKIIQTYHYSRAQFEDAQSKTSMRSFFGKDSDVCFDCPYSMSNGAPLKGCYTHKMNQYSGMISQLRSIGKRYKSWDDIPRLDDLRETLIVSMCAGRYIRFGTYGEPVTMPIELIKRMCNVAFNWTGYTHQWNKPSYYEYRQFFMASTHGDGDTMTAEIMGWRAFMDDSQRIKRDTMVGCPASKEGGYKSDCSKCSLCSGTEGKGNKSVYIFNHS